MRIRQIHLDPERAVRADVQLAGRNQGAIRAGDGDFGPVRAAGIPRDRGRDYAAGRVRVRLDKHVLQPRRRSRFKRDVTPDPAPVGEEVVDDVHATLKRVLIPSLFRVHHDHNAARLARNRMRRDVERKIRHVPQVGAGKLPVDPDLRGTVHAPKAQKESPTLPIRGNGDRAPVPALAHVAVAHFGRLLAKPLGIPRARHPDGIRKRDRLPAPAFRLAYTGRIQPELPRPVEIKHRTHLARRGHTAPRAHHNPHHHHSLAHEPS